MHRKPSSEDRLDLALAAELQAALLPSAGPTDCAHHEAAARNRMCRSIGGDFYDFIRINEDQYAFVIGDVVGHGVRSSLIMTQIIGFLRATTTGLARPQHMVRRLNRYLIDLGRRTDSVLPCTLVYAVVDAPTGLTLLVNAGHPRPFLCTASACSPFPAGPTRNMLLGVEPYEPVEECFTFQPGHRLLLYTDGVIDARGPARTHFGEARLLEATHAHLGGSPDRCAQAIFGAVTHFRQDCPQEDDETVVVIDRL